MPRVKKWTPPEFLVLLWAYSQELTGYKSGTRIGEQIRRLDPPTICTKHARELEARGMITINRSNMRRFEISMTEAGRKLLARRPFDQFEIKREWQDQKEDS